MQNPTEVGTHVCSTQSLQRVPPHVIYSPVQQRSYVSVDSSSHSPEFDPISGDQGIQHLIHISRLNTIPQFASRAQTVSTSKLALPTSKIKDQVCRHFG